MAKKKTLLGSGFRKISPKLRMVANGDSEVNEIRSDFSAAVQMAPSYSLASAMPPQEMLANMSYTASQAPQPATRGSLRSLPDDVRVSVFVERDTIDEQVSVAECVSSISKKQVTAERGRLSTVEIALSDLPAIAEQSSIVRIEMGETLKHPNPKISNAETSAPAKTIRKFSSSGGKNVLVGIIDVGGFDFAHPDFLDSSGNTRFECIWDQGGDVRPTPNGFNFGSEITKQHMDAAIAASDAEGLAPQILEPQSSMTTGSHATHVASIAAGNRGVCRDAFLVGVLIDLPPTELDRRKSFYDSTRIAHAVEYILAKADEIKNRENLDSLPVTINVSLGTNGHAHDGSSAVCRWIENALSTPGRSVAVSAGNAGQEAPEFTGDTGFIMGRIHTSGRIAAKGLVNEIDWVVVGNGVIDVSENELEIWYGPSDRFAVSIKPPGEDWIGPISHGQFIENRQLAEKSFLSVYNEIYHPANGANYIGVYLTPFFSNQQVVGVSPGVWKIRLHGIDVRDGRYHGWIERDDPVKIGAIGQASGWRFPSFFDENSNVDNSSVSSLSCGEQILSVANLDESQQKINASSSQGPTRDGRLKPDIAAPGTEIVAALGFNFEDDDEWIAMTGTSMASPFVCGVVGLMLAENPNLTAAQIRGILQRTSQPLPNDDFSWRDDAGYGAVNPKACLAEVKKLSEIEDLT